MKGGDSFLNPEEQNAEIMYYYRKLISLYDQEIAEAGRCFQGELLASYREALHKEKHEVYAMIDMARQNLQ